MGISKGKMGLIAAAVIGIGAVVYTSSQPDVVPVDMAALERGAMAVTVDADGVTDIADVFEVSAPVSGMVLRSPVAVGDQVVMGDTIVARIEPGAPAFLDERARARAEATLAEAQAGLALANSSVRTAEFDLNNAQRSLNRLHDLHARGTIPPVQLEQAELAVDLAASTLDSAHATVDMRQSQVAAARAALIAPSEEQGAPDEDNCCIALHAPASGTVLSVSNESARMVSAGTALVSIGNPDNIGVLVELLSSDAVRLSIGADASIERWGGETALAATLTEIEPAAFTKVSALGIEEQRVRVRLSFEAGQEMPPLGQGYRVFARITEWQSEDALRLPISALFRSGGDWAVFVVEEGTARQRTVEIGQRNADVAEVLSGLGAGDVVITHPSDRVADGILVEDRETLAK